MNRICPSEEILSEYLCGALSGEAKDELERHLASCADCRRLLAEAHDVVKRPVLLRALSRAAGSMRRNLWLAGAACSFLLSFIYPRYFLQFLVACLIMGGKWIMDSRTSRILIMVQEAWKSGDRDKAEDLIHRFTRQK